MSMYSASGADTDNDDGDEQIPVAVPVAVSMETVVAGAGRGDFDDADESPSGEVAADADVAYDSAGADDDARSHATDVTPPRSPTKKRSNSEADPSSCATDSLAKRRRHNEGKPRQPATKGLTIPFRTIKRIMKIDSEIGIIQNDAAIVATAALEHFVTRLALKSLEISKGKGRNTIKYDDVAEARASDRSLSFLDLLMP